MNNQLAMLMKRLHNFSSFHIYNVDPENGTIQPGVIVNNDILADLFIQEYNLVEQVQMVSAQIAYWGRLAGQAKRVWEITERHYRSWRDRVVLEIINPPIKEENWKKPTDKMTDAMIRTKPEYAMHYFAQERAEEAYNAAMSILEGFRAKKSMLKAAVIRRNEDGAAILNV